MMPVTWGAWGATGWTSARRGPHMRQPIAPRAGGSAFFSAAGSLPRATASKWPQPRGCGRRRAQCRWRCLNATSGDDPGGFRASRLHPQERDRVAAHPKPKCCGFRSSLTDGKFGEPSLARRAPLSQEWLFCWKNPRDREPSAKQQLKAKYYLPLQVDAGRCPRASWLRKRTGVPLRLA
jgi:hypothetical protein